MQQSMFPETVESAVCYVDRDERGFWRLRITTRLQSDLWGASEWVVYSRLSTGELLDVIQMELSQ